MCRNKCCQDMYQNPCINVFSIFFGIISSIALFVLAPLYADNQDMNSLIIGIIIALVVLVVCILYCAIGCCVTGSSVYCGDEFV